MYNSKKRVLPPKKRWKVLKFGGYLALIGLLAFGIWLYLRNPKLRVNDGGGILVPTRDTTPPKKHIAEPLYEFDLPGDWKEIGRKDKPYRMITWQGTAKESAARIIDLYIDTMPATLAINRILPVSGQGDRLAINAASPNCVTLSPDTASLTPEQATKLPERKLVWDSVSFICDIPNSLRNVVGAGSVEGINRVSLTGPKNGKHLYFFVYTDHSAHPDEQTFPEVLRSFRAL